MQIRVRPRSIVATLVLMTCGFGALAIAQSGNGKFAEFWGRRYGPGRVPAMVLAERAQRARPAPFDSRTRLIHWNRIAIDASGVDHTPITDGEDRVFGEQLGPGRASRAMAIVHVAIFDAVNAITDEWEGYSDPRPPLVAGASVDAAIAVAAHDTLASLFPSQAASFDAALTEDLARIPLRGKATGAMTGRRAAAAVLALRADDGAAHAEPRLGSDFFTSNEPGKWRQDPVSQIPVALGARWGSVKPFVIQSAVQFRAPAPPALNSSEYAAAFAEVARLGGDGTITPTERTSEQSSTGIYWAYDGMPSLCAPPRLYNQIALTIADQMGSDFFETTRLLALINVAMADTGIAIWESKYFYQLWRPVTGVREADAGTGPSGLGDGNEATTGIATFLPLGAPASNLSGPDFTPPFPSYPSGHAGFGGALFEVLRQFYGRDDIAFTFTSDEYDGMTLGRDGEVRPLHPRSFTSLSQAEEENGQSRIYLGIHWSFDKTAGIQQGRQVARYVMQNAFGARRVRF